MKVGVVGLGYVGLPLAVAFAKQGNEAVGLDADPHKVDALVEHGSYVEDVPRRGWRRSSSTSAASPATSRPANLVRL